MSVRTLLLGLAACATAAPALAATTPQTSKMHHMTSTHSAMTHTTMMHHGHMTGHMMHGSSASADNSADELNAKSLMNAQGGGGAMSTPGTMPPAKPAGGGT